MEEKSLLDKILQNHKNKQNELDIYLTENKQDIIKALNMKIPIKTIYETIKQEVDTDITYDGVYKKIKNFIDKSK